MGYAYPFGAPAQNLGLIASCMVLASTIFFVERATREQEALPGLVHRSTLVPNYKHLWSTHDMVFRDGASGLLNNFGKDFIQEHGDWRRLCQLDSDGDGRTNGEEMGDPCCAWTARTAQHNFALDHHQEYRRWLLSNPGKNDDASKLQRDPAQCESYNQTEYAAQFSSFYYSGLDRANEPAQFDYAQNFCFFVFVATVTYWLARKDFLSDLLPLSAAEAPARRTVGLAIFLASFFFLDLLSGVVHIMLDYAPHWLPVVGPLAYGTQLHHHDTTAFLQESPVNHVGHVHLILPIIPVLVIASKGSRLQRLWWFWTAVWAHMFQLTHRWSHMTPESIPWLLRVAQDAKILLNHEWHMIHHQDNTINFCFLSGQIGTDTLLNFACSIVSPARYDFWMVVLMGMLLLPAVVDWYVRSKLLRMDSKQLKGWKFLMNGNPAECAGEDQGLHLAAQATKQYGLTMPEGTTTKAHLWKSKTSVTASGLASWMMVSSIVLHFLPHMFLLLSHCSEFGCFNSGCDQYSSDHQCIPSVSNTELIIESHPASRVRHAVTLCVAYLRAPVMALLMLWACQQVMEDDQPIFAHIFKGALLAVVALEVIATSVPHEGSTKQLHVMWSVLFLIVWLGVVVPLYTIALSNAGYNARPVCSMWIFLLLGAAWLGVSWHILGGVQWYLVEWACVFGNSILFMVIGATLPHAPDGGDHKHAIDCFLTPSSTDCSA